MAQPRFVVRRGKVRRNRYHVVLVAENGEPLSSSEVLNSIDAVHRNIEAQLEAVPLVKRIDWPD